jgi:redox-sensitive bicupin YhaK (pirin superfamily)
VTFVLDGHLRHADNRGNSGVLVEGDVQWMTAGGGIIHAELPWQEHTAHTLQLWLNLPSHKKMTPSHYQDLRGMESVVARDDGVDVRVISGRFDGVEAATENIVPVSYLDVRMAAGKATSLPIPASYNGFLLVVEGVVEVGPERTAARPGDVVWLDYPAAESGDSLLTVRSDIDARYLVITGRPVREKVIAQGPFVMNTSEEIFRAYSDYRAGRFGGPTPAAMELMEADEEMFERLSKAAEARATGR